MKRQQNYKNTNTYNKINMSNIIPAYLGKKKKILESELLILGNELSIDIGEWVIVGIIEFCKATMLFSFA